MRGFIVISRRQTGQGALQGDLTRPIACAVLVKTPLEVRIASIRSYRRRLGECGFGFLATFPKGRDASGWFVNGAGPYLDGLCFDALFPGEEASRPELSPMTTPRSTTP